MKVGDDGEENVTGGSSGAEIVGSEFFKDESAGDKIFRGKSAEADRRTFGGAVLAETEGDLAKRLLSRDWFLRGKGWISQERK